MQGGLFRMLKESAYVHCASSLGVVKTVGKDVDVDGHMRPRAHVMCCEELMVAY